MTKTTCLIGAALALLLVSEVVQNSKSGQYSETTEHNNWKASQNNNQGNSHECNGKDGAQGKNDRDGGNCGSGNHEPG